MGLIEGQVTILPAQMRRLAEISEEVQGAIGVIQFGNMLEVNTGKKMIKIDAKGRTVVYTKQRKRT